MPIAAESDLDKLSVEGFYRSCVLFLFAVLVLFEKR